MGYKRKKTVLQENVPSEFGDLLSAPVPPKPSRKRKWLKWGLYIFLFLMLIGFVGQSLEKNNGKPEGTGESAKKEQSVPKQINKELKETVRKGIKKYINASSYLPKGSPYSWTFSELNDDICDMYIKFDEHLETSDFESLAYAVMAGIISGYEENNKSTKSISIKLDIHVGDKHIGTLHYPSVAGAAWELME